MHEMAHSIEQDEAYKQPLLDDQSTNDRHFIVVFSTNSRHFGGHQFRKPLKYRDFSGFSL
jgi:hypothetical protein